MPCSYMWELLTWLSGLRTVLATAIGGAGGRPAVCVRGGEASMYLGHRAGSTKCRVDECIIHHNPQLGYNPELLLNIYS
jgi:hypothetical protein